MATEVGIPGQAGGSTARVSLESEGGRLVSDGLAAC